MFWWKAMMSGDSTVPVVMELSSTAVMGIGGIDFPIPFLHIILETARHIS